MKAKLHPNAKRNVDQVYHQVAKDVKKHRALVVDGDLKELGTTVSSPFEAVDKLLPDRSISKEKRIVHDQRTINKGTSKVLAPTGTTTHARAGRQAGDVDESPVSGCPHFDVQEGYRWSFQVDLGSPARR